MIFKQVPELISGAKIETRRLAKPGETLDTFVMELDQDGKQVGPIEVTRVLSTDKNGVRREKYRTGRDYPIVPKMYQPALTSHRVVFSTIRREPLHAIDELAARNEGVADIAAYRELWGQINGPRSWGQNPDVHVYGGLIVVPTETLNNLPRGGGTPDERRELRFIPPSYVPGQHAIYRVDRWRMREWEYRTANDSGWWGGHERLMIYSPPRGPNNEVSVRDIDGSTTAVGMIPLRFLIPWPDHELAVVKAYDTARYYNGGPLGDYTSGYHKGVLDYLRNWAWYWSPERQDWLKGSHDRAPYAQPQRQRLGL